MKVEPAIDRASLSAKLDELYRLPVASLTFVPEGEASFAYLVNCTDGARRFLKLWADTRQGRMQRARLDTFLPITRELYERGLFRELPYPIPTTSGALHAGFGDYALALFAYIDGRTLEAFDFAAHPEIDERQILDQVAHAFAGLHRATPLLSSPLPHQSAFEMSFVVDMRRGLAALDVVGSHHRPGQIRLRDLLLPRRNQLLDRLANTEQLAETARERAGELVLCHTDMGGNNVIVDAAGKVYILDWDDVILAPAEHDLQEYRDWHFSLMLETYVREGGVAALDPLQFAFYLQRRYLADLTDWLIRILEENTEPAQDAFDLAGIEAYSLARLDNFTAEMDAITQTLASVAGNSARLA